ncbi:NAD(P)H-binding protein [Corynebacterium lowii]|uniref:NmrA-like family protein n=1 Tax=Corynebacterium lowii TaxID=1544413 RepID=A0A0N8VZU4_9CORY|nr:NAD(P)H-binding protein [Corynebacterium lowii]KQB84866.1 NmrA-like family protein [Corynebacterium lowii]MDP9851770.1 uncharacterized protein YbjT (DUF2867 family) [Corynebacterium lowii]
MDTIKNLLIIGATGQIGQVVVKEALAAGIQVTAQTRNTERAAQLLPEETHILRADPTDAAALRPLLRDVEGIILTHGGDVDGRQGQSFYDVVAALLEASEDKPDTPIALMTSMGVSTVPARYEFVAWKRRAERLVRASGRRYTIVRPGWFGYEAPGDQQIDLRQGDLLGGQPGVSIAHVAQVLLGALTAPSAARRTVELFSQAGERTTDIEAAFSPTRADEHGVGKAILDAVEVPLGEEPAVVQEALSRFSRTA